MRKPTAIGLVALLLGLAALLAAPPSAGAQDEVKLGAFLPISGISADVGAQMKAGTEVALERMATLQVGGKPMKVRVIWYDDEGKGDVGLNVVTRALTVDKIHVGMGFLSSDVFIRVMDEFQKASTPVVTCCSASLKIGDKIAQNKMQHVFQLSPTANDIARSAGRRGRAAREAEEDRAAQREHRRGARLLPHRSRLVRRQRQGRRGRGRRVRRSRRDRPDPAVGEDQADAARRPPSARSTAPAGRCSSTSGSS